MKSKTVQIGALLFCVVVWALSFPVIKYLLAYFDPIALSTVRFALGSLALFPFFISRKDAIIGDIGGRWRLFLLFSLFVVPLPDLMQNFGMRMMDPETAASVASILQPMSPIFVLILASLFLSEKFTLHKGLGVLVAFSGAVLLSTGGLKKVEAGSLAGEFLILMSAFSYAASGIIGKDLLRKASPLSIITWSYFLGTLFLLPFYSLSSGIPAMSPMILGALLFLSVFTLIPYFLWYVVLKDNEVSRQSAYVFLIPLFGVVFSSMFLGENLSPQMLLYGALIMSGVYVSQRSKIFIKYYS